MDERATRFDGPYIPAFKLDAALARAVNAHELGLRFEGCPCFELRSQGLRFVGHCWRSGDDCGGCGVHVSGTADDTTKAHVAAALKRALDAMEWGGEWKIVSTSRTF